MPDAQNGVWAGDAWTDYGSGGGASPSDPTITSDLGNVVDQSGAYEPELTIEAGSTVLTAATDINVPAGVVVTNPTATTPSIPEPSEGHIFLVTHTVTDPDGLTHVLPRVVAKAPTSAAMAPVTTYNYASDNKVATITVGGGDTVIYEADETTPKGTVNAYNRTGSPTTSVEVVSDGVDFQTVKTGSSQAATLNWLWTDADADFDAADELIAIDVVLTDIVLAANDDQVGIYLSSATDAFSANSSGLQIRLVSGATEHRRRRFDSGSETSTSFTSGIGNITSIAIRWLLYHGRVHDMLYQLNATSPITVTKAGGSVIRSWGGGGLGSLEGTPEAYGSPWYISIDAGPRGTSGQVDCKVTHTQTNKVVIS